jgi:hypothetical protein
LNLGETDSFQLRRMQGRIREHVTTCRNGMGGKGIAGRSSGAVSRSRAAHQGQSSGPNEVSEGARQGAVRLTAPVGPYDRKSREHKNG